MADDKKKTAAIGRRIDVHETYNSATGHESSACRENNWPRQFKKSDRGPMMSRASLASNAKQTGSNCS